MSGTASPGGGAHSQPERSNSHATLEAMAREVYDLTIALNAAFARMSAEVKRRRAAGISDLRTMEQVDRAADTPERKDAQAQVEKALGLKTGIDPEVARIAEDYAMGRRRVR
jgi:hypothetical protein